MMNFFPPPPRAARTFNQQYYCNSMAIAGRGNLEDGDKILLPSSALDVLARMNVVYPMMFELKNTAIGKRTHCGVLEFSTNEGNCNLPFWMMHGLFLEEGSLVDITNVSLPKATFVKFQAMSVDFLNVSDPKAVMEITLRKFTCLTEGDQICLSYDNDKYYLEVKEVVPGGAACIIEADFSVDFEEPVGYKESKYGKQEQEAKERILAKAQEKQLEDSKVVPRVLQKSKVEEEVVESVFVPFSGGAKRADGKVVSSSSSSSAPSATSSSSSSAGTISSPGQSLGGAAYKSRIGDKYSKKKTAVSAFTGTAHKL